MGSQRMATKNKKDFPAPAYSTMWLTHSIEMIRNGEKGVKGLEGRHQQRAKTYKDIRYLMQRYDIMRKGQRGGGGGGDLHSNLWYAAGVGKPAEPFLYAL